MRRERPGLFLGMPSLRCNVSVLMVLREDGAHVAPFRWRWIRLPGRALHEDNCFYIELRPQLFCYSW